MAGRVAQRRRTFCKVNQVAGTLHPLGLVCLSMTAFTTLLLSGFTASSWVMVMICGVSAGVRPPGGASEAHTQSGPWQFWGLQSYQLGNARQAATSTEISHKRTKGTILLALAFKRMKASTRFSNAAESRG
jgi:hypothetical protein